MIKKKIKFFKDYFDQKLAVLVAYFADTSKLPQKKFSHLPLILYIKKKDIIIFKFNDASFQWSSIRLGQDLLIDCFLQLANLKKKIIKFRNF
jgi:hypothetical protein